MFSFGSLPRIAVYVGSPLPPKIRIRNTSGPSILDRRYSAPQLVFIPRNKLHFCYVSIYMVSQLTRWKCLQAEVLTALCAPWLRGLLAEAVTLLGSQRSRDTCKALSDGIFQTHFRVETNLLGRYVQKPILL